MTIHEIYFHDLNPAVQEEIATEHGYESPAEYIRETNGDVVPIAELDMYDKGEEPPEDEADSSHAPDCTYRMGHAAECNCHRSKTMK